MPEDAAPAFEKILFATDEPPEGLEENIVRFNRMLDACGVPAETRSKCYGLAIAGIHGIPVNNAPGLAKQERGEGRGSRGEFKK